MHWTSYTTVSCSNYKWCSRILPPGSWNCARRRTSNQWYKRYQEILLDPSVRRDRSKVTTVLYTVGWKRQIRLFELPQNGQKAIVSTKPTSSAAIRAARGRNVTPCSWLKDWKHFGSVEVRPSCASTWVTAVELWITMILSQNEKSIIEREYRVQSGWWEETVV